MDFTVWAELSRILLATLLGAVIGLERELHEKPAGLRTHTLLCVGVSLFTVISLHVGMYYHQDPGRIAAQVVSGLGFLGAGVILRDGMRITGVTTAATVWLTAAVGMAVGFGYYQIAVGTTILALLVQTLFTHVETGVSHAWRRDYFRFKCDPSMECLEDILKTVRAAGLNISHPRVTKISGRFYVQCGVKGHRATINQVMSKLLEDPRISDFE